MKRTHRANVLFDEIDLEMLEFLLYCEEHSMLGWDMKYNLELSHNSYYVHIKRLTRLGFIKYCRLEENYKRKTITLTDRGRILIKLMLEATKDE